MLRSQYSFVSVCLNIDPPHFSFLFSFLFFFNSPFLTINPLLYIRTLNDRGRVRIIPEDSGMGVEDWKAEYKMWVEGSLSDYLDKEECDLDRHASMPNDVIQFTTTSQDSTISQQPMKTTVKTLLNPTYPESYNTIDRRLRKKVRVTARTVNRRTECTREDVLNSDLAILRQKRGELTEMEEEDENMMPCLRPYKSGLFYKTRIQAKNKLEHTLRDYVVYRDEEETRLIMSVDTNSDGSDEMQGSEEESKEFWSEINQHCKRDKKDSSSGGYSDTFMGRHDRKTTKGKIGGWTPEVLLSPVEEPSDEFVDPMDELQCLVESVSEYLAEKEEEISKYGSLPEPSKSRLSSQDSARTESLGDEQGVASKELKEGKAIEVKERRLPEQGSGKKNAINLLFSSLTDRIVPSSKQTSSDHVQCSKTLDNAESGSGLSKLLSFMTKSPSPAPVAVVTPSQETPPDNRKFFMPTQQPDAKPQEIQNVPLAKNIQNTSEIVEQNPHFFFSDSGVDGTSKDFSEKVRKNDLCSHHRHLLDKSDYVQDLRQSGDQIKIATETQTKSDHCEAMSQKPTSDLDFFSPLKKSFSSLISPVPAQHQTQTVFPVYRSENDVRKTKDYQALSNGNKMKVSVLDLDNASTQQLPKTERAMFSGHLKFASGDESGELKSSSHNTVKSDQTPPVSNSATKVSLNSDKAKPPTQNLTEMQPTMTLETSWFSSLFKTASNENVKAASPQSQRLVNQSSQTPTGSCQNRAKNEHQQTVHEQMHNIKRTLNTEIPLIDKPNTSQTETSGLFSTLFKSSSSDDITGPKTGLKPVKGGLFSGIIKFVSAGDVSKDTQTNPGHPRNEPSQTANPTRTHADNQPHAYQSAHSVSSLGVRCASGKEPPQPIDRTDRDFSQEPPPPPPASSQQGGMLSGLFKFVSSDGLSNNQANSWQHQNVPASTHPSHQPAKQNVQKHQSGILNDRPSRQKIIKESSSSEQQSIPKNVRQSSLKSKSTEQYPSQTLEDTQSGILSGIFNKLRASSEEVAQTKRDQKQEWKSVEKEASFQNVPSYKQQPQQQAVEKDQNSLDSEGQSVECMGERKCVTMSASLISGNLKKGSCETSSGVGMEMDAETNGSAMFASHPQRCNDTVGNSVSVFSNGNKLDLTTSASYQMLEQLNVTCISNSTGHLPQVTHFQNSFPSTCANNLYSVDNFSSFPTDLAGKVQTPQPYLTRSYPSLYSSPQQQAFYNNSFYGLGHSYEHCWSQNSVQGKQVNNQYSHGNGEYSHAKSLEAFVESSQSLSMNSNENTVQQFGSANDWMAFNNSLENEWQECHGNIANKLWSNYNGLDMMNNLSSCIEDGGALNLSKKSNAKNGSWHSRSEGSYYSLNSVAYLKGHYEEHPANASYSANKENMCPISSRQPTSNQCYPDLIGCPNGWSYASATCADTENYAYFEDIEWYQQWLLLLEQGMWWPADDGDCGYFVYTDHEYIYALLTDGSGQYVYACAPEDEVWGNGQVPDNYPSALLHNEMVIVCGFKIPLYSEDELFWIPGQDQNEAQLLNAPLDLSDAYRKGNEIMNLTLERFSQMFEGSIPAQRQQAMDFSLYQLNKVKMDTRQQPENGLANRDFFPEVLDLRVKGTNCNLNNKRTKEILSEKVCVSICPTSTTNSLGVYNCYQPCLRRRSSSGLQVKHIDDTSEEEWQKSVQPVEEETKNPIKKISSLFSSLVGKVQKSEPQSNITGSKTFTTAKNATHPAINQEQFDKSSVPEAHSEIKGIPSAGLQGIKSDTIKNVHTSVTKERTNKQTTEIRSSRVLPNIPTSVSAHGQTHKPKLPRQVSQQSSIPEVPTSLTKVTSKSASSIDTQGDEKPSEQNKHGFLSFFKNAIGIEDANQESVKCSQAVTKQTVKNKSVLDGVNELKTDKCTGTIQPPGSVGDVLNIESTTPQLPPKKSYSNLSSARHQSFGSRNDAEEIGIKKTQGQSRLSLGSQSDIPKALQTPEEQISKSVSPIFSPNVNDGSIPGGSQTMPSTSCNKSNFFTKSTSGLFGFSIAISGHTNNKNETAGKGILSLFSDDSQQVPPQKESASQSQVEGESAKDTTGNRIWSLLGSSGTEKAALFNESTEKTHQNKRSSIGLLSVFNASSSQQTSSLHTGSSGQPPSLKEAPGVKVLHEFSDPISQQNSTPTTPTSQQSSHGIAPQDPPSAASQETGSFFGGILGSLSAYNEKPVKSLFSRLGGSTPQPSSTIQPISGPTEIIEKMPKQQQGIDMNDEAQKTQSAINNYSEAIPQKETPRKGLLSLFGFSSPQKNTPQATPIQSGFLPGTSGNRKGTKGLLSEQNAKTCLQINAPANQTPGASFMENEQSSKTSTEAVSAVPTDITLAVDTISVPMESASHLPNPPEVPSQNAASGLLSLFSGPSLQNTAPEAGSVLGGLFPGATGQKDIPGKSLLSMISGPSSKSSSDAEHGKPSASKEPLGKSVFSMFGGTKPQPPTSLLGGMFPADLTLKDVSGSGLLSMLGGPSPSPPPSQTEATSKPPKAEAHSNLSSSSSQESTSKSMLFSEKKNLELQNVQVIISGHSEVDNQPSDTVSGETVETNKPVTLQAHPSTSKQQNICHSITEAEKETMDGKAKAKRQGMWESTVFYGELVENIPQGETQPQPKPEDVTTLEFVIADQEGQQKPAEVGKSAFDASSNVVSGFMSKMFSGVSGPPKTSSGLFSSAQTSLFKATCTKGSESNQTASLFAFPSSLPTDSLKSDLLGLFKSSGEASSLNGNLNLKCATSTESTEFAVQDQSMPKDIVSSGDIKLTENFIKAESDLAQHSQHQVIKSENSFTNISPANVSPPEVTSLPRLRNDVDEVVGSDIVIPMVIVGEPEDTLTDRSGPAQQSLISEPPQSMFGMAGVSPPKFSFITESEDARKSFGSLLSSAANKGLPTMPQTDGSGLFSGFKTFSASLFSEKKSVASHNESTSLFGVKLDLWQKEAPIPTKTQTPCAPTAQANSQGFPKRTSETDRSLLVLKEMKENGSKTDNEIIHGQGTVVDLDTSEFEDQNQSIGSLDESILQMSTLEIDGPSKKEQKSQPQHPSFAAFSSGLQEECKELLSAKRLVPS